jgi:hypothetical protein
VGEGFGPGELGGGGDDEEDLVIEPDDAGADAGDAPVEAPEPEPVEVPEEDEE